MELQTALQQLEGLQQKLYAFRTASSALYLDGVTVAPRDTSEGRGVALGILAGEEHKLFSSAETGELIAYLETQKEQLSPEVARQVQLLRRSYDQLSRIPADSLSLPKLWQRHPFLIPWTIILICWLPYFIIRLPADAVGCIVNNNSGMLTEEITDFSYAGYWMDGSQNDQGHYCVTGWN